MKKTTLIMACLGLLSLASCKKDRSCTCTTTYTHGNGPNNTYTETTNATLTKISKGDAKNACSNSSSTTNEGGSTDITVRTCKLN